MCARCDELEDRVAWLEGELGIRQDETHLARMRQAIRLTLPGGRLGVARMLIALYRAGGRTMNHEQLLLAVPPADHADDGRDPKILNVWVCWARKALGRDIIDTVWGHGFCMSDAARARVTAIIEPEARAA